MFIHPCTNPLLPISNNPRSLLDDMLTRFENAEVMWQHFMEQFPPPIDKRCHRVQDIKMPRRRYAKLSNSLGMGWATKFVDFMFEMITNYWMITERYSNLNGVVGCLIFGCEIFSF